MKKDKTIWMALFLVVAVSIVMAAGQYKQSDGRLAPKLLNYQGFLTDTLGNPLTNPSVSLSFAIFDSPSGGSQKWSETQSTVSIEKGIFNVLLGSVTAIPDSVFVNSTNRWLELTVAGQVLTPRTRIVSSGYAYTSTYSDTAQYARNSAPDNNWSFLISDGSDTTLQMGGQWGLARAGNVLFGNADSTHVNLGVACTTGTSGQDYKYCTVGGGYLNAASGTRATVSGGYYNFASGNRAFVGGGVANTASNSYSAVAGGWYNTASGYGAHTGGGSHNASNGDYSVVGGGQYNTAGDSCDFIGGGYYNHVASKYSTIPGGYADTIFAGADYSFLYGINSNLTQDSTFMIDMPHTRFGDEATGYEFPRQRGTTGQVMVTDASGQLSWATGSGGADNHWTYLISDGADTTLQSGGRWGLARAGSTLYGNADSTHVNLGVACTTGTTGQNYKYCTVAGGQLNKAGNLCATVNGGYSNTASGIYSSVGGGRTNSAVNGYATVAGGYSNTAVSLYATVAGGVSNTASGDYATVGGGYSNAADTNYAAIGGGYSNTASGYAAAIGGGRLNTAGGSYAIAAGGYSNAADSTYAAVGGGYNNTAGSYAAVVGGGYTNIASSYAATINGGRNNYASDTCTFVGGGRYNKARGPYSVVCGGGGPLAIDSNLASGNYSVIGGGRRNIASNYNTVVAGGFLNEASGGYTTISGGNQNIASGDAAMVGGGYFNWASGDNSFVGGGRDNTAGGYRGVVGGGYLNYASGVYSTIPGGYNNTASGNMSFAAGNRASAAHRGCFVWADSSSGTTFSSTVANQFRVRATGGIDLTGNVAIRNTSGTIVVELGEGLDYAEGFDVHDKDKISPGMFLAIDPKNPGKLKLSDEPYDIKVAGITAGAKNLGSGVRLGKDKFDCDVALAGRVYCNVDATAMSIEPGDLLTTSATPGYAMKVTDYARAQGAILGKAMQKLGKGQKGQILVLVTLQ